ncbi:sarcosine oxidase subunit gamma [Gluconacetobacter tumulisoli]|uniref:Sarcosine oxidase subunit gamma n=1 Tax=Gluconacetobacter tumulisoli TaxID=1286189 RepID=A0A7W4PLP9_9PROT|nr:sarcosine oxidase subunit gamma family protein [Gluconacetobacter tumulisoli]MBB2202375.1 sarcosine oxidase subunit gamma [Gluconacetobacter tumulisoli]
MPDPLHARGPLSPSACSYDHGGIRITDMSGRQVAGVALLGGDRAALDATVRQAWGVDLPDTPRIVAGSGLTFAWAGPDQWLALSDAVDDSGPDLEHVLRTTLGPLAAVTDQGDSRVALRISGPGSRDALSRLLPIDLHPRAFSPGNTALTLAGHIGVQVWQVDSCPTYDILVFRSFARSLHHDLCAAARGAARAA